MSAFTTIVMGLAVAGSLTPPMNAAAQPVPDNSAVSTLQLAAVQGGVAAHDQHAPSLVTPLAAGTSHQSPQSIPVPSLLSASVSVAVATPVASAGAASALPKYLSRELFVELFPMINDPVARKQCPGASVLTYDDFLSAASNPLFSGFLSSPSDVTNKRELAAFLAQASQETNGGNEKSGGYFYLQGGLCQVVEGSLPDLKCPFDLCQPTPEWPSCPSPAGYCGRGALQLSYSWNYGIAGKALGLDLLQNPQQIAENGRVAWTTSLWFWMTPEGTKPSCHEAMTTTQPTIANGRPTGFGLVTNIINGGVLHCGSGGMPAPDEQMKIAYYKRYCDILGVSYGPNIDCQDPANANWAMKP